MHNMDSFIPIKSSNSTSPSLPNNHPISLTLFNQHYFLPFLQKLNNSSKQYHDTFTYHHSQFIIMSVQQPKYDYLKAKYMFRYPFTITSLKWGIVLGTFIALHTFVKSRNLKKSFQYFCWSSMLTTFPIWAYFMIKYSFYEGSIRRYEDQDSELIRQYQEYQKYMQYKLNIDHDSLSEQQLVQRYDKYVKSVYSLNSQLDCLLQGIDSKTFD